MHPFPVHDGAIEHIDSPPPPQKNASSAKHRHGPGAPIMIAYVPNSPPSYRNNDLAIITGSWEQLGAAKHLWVSWAATMVIRSSLS
jgi:hypothetical protein